jgi:hypothetical protein
LVTKAAELIGADDPELLRMRGRDPVGQEQGRACRPGHEGPGGGSPDFDRQFARELPGADQDAMGSIPIVDTNRACAGVETS